MSISRKAIGTEAIGFPGSALVPAVSVAGVPKANRAFLVEVQPFDSGSSATVKLGFSDNIQCPHLDGFAWHPVLKTALTSSFGVFSKDMTPTTRVAPDVGQIDILVGDGTTFLDSTGTSRDLRVLDWEGRKIRILFGDSTRPFEEFLVLFDGKAEDAIWTEGVFSIQLFDKGKDLQVPIQDASFLGDGTVGEGGKDLKGELKPLCYGVKRNIEPAQVDAATRVYRWHEGSSAEVLGVFDRGNELTSAGDITALGLPSIANWTPIGGQYVTDLAKSLVRLGAEPDGMVTIDVRGDNTNGYVDRIGDIIQRILTTKGPLLVGDIHQGDLNQFNLARGGPSGLYLRAGVNINILLQDWVSSVNGFWFFDRVGIFHLKKLGFSGSKATIAEKDILSIQRSQTTPPIWKARVGYRNLGVEQGLGDLNLPTTTSSQQDNLLTNLANTVQTGEVVYLDKVLLASFTGDAPETLSAGVWFTDPTSDVVNMRVELLFFDTSDSQVGVTAQGNFVVGASAQTRSVVENIAVPAGATKVTMRTIGDSGQADVENEFAMLNQGTVALPFVAGGVASGIANFNTRNDRNGTAITVPTIAIDGTAVDHTVNTDGSVDLSFEWLWTGTDEDIDGWEVFLRSSTSGTSYNFGTSPAQETVAVITAEKRAHFFYGVPGDLNYTFGIRAFRKVDPDIVASRLIQTGIIQPALASEDPFLPTANIAFAGDITGTVGGVAASTVATVATNFNTRNDRNGDAILVPIINTDGTAVDHTINTDGSSDISFEWLWIGMEEDIDGFEIITRSSTSSASYNMGTTPDEELSLFVSAEKRAFIIRGTGTDLFYTFAVRAFRKVDPDIAVSRLILSALVQPSRVEEDPFQPATSVAFAGDITGTIDGTAATTVANAVANFDTRNDRDGTAVVVPVVVSTGAAVDHTVNTDGSANVSFEWTWGGVESDIDGFIIYQRQSTSGASYNFGTTPTGETTFVVPADRRAHLVYGVGIDLQYTFGIQAFRRVDPDVAASGIILSAIIQPSLASEDPFQPATNVAFNGDITGTVNGVAAGDVADGSQNARPTLALALNKQTNGATNSGEATAFAVGTDGTVDLNADGFFYFDNVKTTVLRGEVGSGATAVTWVTGTANKRGYFVYDSSAPFTISGGSGKTAVAFKDANGNWFYDNNTGTPIAFTPTATTLALGWCETASVGDGLLKGGFFGQVSTLEAIGETDVGTEYITPFAVTQVFADEGADANLTTSFVTFAGVTVTGEIGDQIRILVTANIRKATHSGAQVRVDSKILVGGVEIGGLNNELLAINSDSGRLSLPIVLQADRTLGATSETFDFQLSNTGTETGLLVRDPTITVVKQLR